MSSTVERASVAERRRLSGRTEDTVNALMQATAAEVVRTGYEGLTVRSVARCAGVSPATAYTYFASKEHLLTELFWRRLSALNPPAAGSRADTGRRVSDAVRPIASMLEAEPELAAAATTALLAHDPDVKAIRDRIGSLLARRLTDAVGRDGNATALQVLVLTFTGAMISAGMGNLTYADLPAVMARATRQLVTRA